MSLNSTEMWETLIKWGEQFLRTDSQSNIDILVKNFKFASRRGERSVFLASGSL